MSVGSIDPHRLQLGSKEGFWPTSCVEFTEGLTSSYAAYAIGSRHLTGEGPPRSSEGFGRYRSHSIRGATEWVNSPTDSRLVWDVPFCAASNQTGVVIDVGALVLIGFVSLLGFAESRSSKRRVW